jgi:hypothetical protein
LTRIGYEHSEEIPPYDKNDFFEAILTCEEDHFRFVGDELDGVVKSQQFPIDILRAYIDKNRRIFLDLKMLPAYHDYESCPGYTNVHKGRDEFLFSENKLKEIMGCQGAVNG